MTWVANVKSLPGGGPQGTLLGLFLFLILINEVGFEGQVNNVGEMATSKRNIRAINQIHLKYVDDLSVAESINLKDILVPADPDRVQPDTFHARTGHVLTPEDSAVYNQLVKTNEYAAENQMKINDKKTKLMVFNPCTSVDFAPVFQLNGNQLDVVEEMRLLGVIVRSDMTWKSNTEHMVLKAYKKLWIMRRLKKLGANEEELKDIYIKQVRSVLELAVPAWQGAITQAERNEIERFQKAAHHIILGEKYLSYRSALKQTGLQTLESRREKLCLKFVKKAVKNTKHRKWFKVSHKTAKTRQKQTKYCKVVANKGRYQKSPIGYLTSLLNNSGSK